MDGSAASLITIPVVVTLGLLTWLGLIAYAVRHPRWTHSTSTTARATGIRGGQPMIPGPRPADHVVIAIGADGSADKPARLAA